MTFTVSTDDIVREHPGGLLDIHSTWSRVRLRQIASVLNGFAFKSSAFSTGGEGTPLIRIRDILQHHTETNYRGAYDPLYLVKEGDLLVGMDGDFNSARWKGPTALLNQRVCKIVCNQDLYDPRFLDYALPGYLLAINRFTSSMTVKHLSSRTVEDIPLPLPPLREQHRIVAKLEELFSDLEAGVAALQRVAVNLKRYRASVLKAAVDGSLTAEWRTTHPATEPASALLQRILEERRATWERDQQAKDNATGRPLPTNWKTKYKEPITPDTTNLPALPDGWCWATFEQCAIDVTVGHVGPMKTEYVPDGIPFLRSQNVRPLRFDREGLQYISAAFNRRLSKSVLCGGELLVVRSGNIGDACVYPSDEPQANCADLVIARLTAGLSAAYAAAFISSPLGRRLVGNRGTGSALTHFNVGAMKTSAVPLPPVAEQEQIVAEVARLLSHGERSIELCSAAVARSSRLRKAILSRAFSGALVNQDPTEEPASALLERIRAQRATVSNGRVPSPQARRRVRPAVVEVTE